jgi:hypothetical protein
MYHHAKYRKASEIENSASLLATLKTEDLSEISFPTLFILSSLATEIGL